MGVLSFVSGLFTPATKLIETLDLKGNQKQALLNELAKIQEEANAKLIELEKAALDATTKRIEAESKSENWLTSSWRPLSSVVLISIAVLACFDIAHPAPQFWDLVGAVVGINMSSRGLEKKAKVGGLGSIVKGLK